MDQVQAEVGDDHNDSGEMNLAGEDESVDASYQWTRLKNLFLVSQTCKLILFTMNCFIPVMNFNHVILQNLSISLQCSQTKIISIPIPAVDNESPSFRQLITYQIY